MMIHQPTDPFRGVSLNLTESSVLEIDAIRSALADETGPESRSAFVRKLLAAGLDLFWSSAAQEDFEADLDL